MARRHHFTYSQMEVSRTNPPLGKARHLAGEVLHLVSGFRIRACHRFLVVSLIRMARLFYGHLIGKGGANPLLYVSRQSMFWKMERMYTIPVTILLASNCANVVDEANILYRDRM
jgi:hypothetical protein